MSGLQVARFAGILFLLFAYTLYKAGQLWPTRRSRAHWVATLVFILMVGWQILYRSKPGVFSTLGFQSLAWVGSITLGLWAVFVILSLPFDIVSGVLFLGRLFFSPSSDKNAAQAERRQFVTRSLQLGILGVSSGTGTLGLVEVLVGPRVKKVSIPISNLPSELQGFKIAQISDLHAGATIRESYVQDIVAKIAALSPDLIVVTGDIADGVPEVMGHLLTPLESLTAKYGKFYITGNHEYYWDADGWIRKMQGLGFRPLLNENQMIRVTQSAQILLAGVTDPAGEQLGLAHAADLKKAAESHEPTHVKVLLAHRPEAYLEAEKVGFDLQLSGHTHAGQFFPFNIFMPLAHKYYRGLNRHGRMWLYVNPGTGYWGPPNRFSVPAEITLLTLMRLA